MAKKKKDAPSASLGTSVELNANEILSAEFAYLAQAAFQANEDRARVTNFYMVAVGSLIAAVVSIQFEGLPTQAIYWGFTIVFLALSAVSVLTILQLARLRRAWHSAAEAMNQIKSFYAEQLNIAEAFAWNAENLPSKYKPGSVSHTLAVEVALLGAATAAATILFGRLGLGLTANLWAFSGAGYVVAFALLTWIYRRVLRD
jgi:membrane protein implicated in regulation of membrane protease activity